MKHSLLSGMVGAGAVVMLAVGSLVWADDPKPEAGQMPLPPGWTMDDMQACIKAGTPGKMHQYLQKDVGEWEGKTSMVMAPGMPVIESTCKSTVTSIMDGRYVQVDYSGEMPGMGQYKGTYIYGFDNVSQKFVVIGFDNMGTGIMNGVGELSADGKVLTSTYTYNCPIQKKAVTMREVDTATSDKTKKLEMYGNDPKTGVEYKMMTIELTNKS